MLQLRLAIRWLQASTRLVEEVLRVRRSSAVPHAFNSILNDLESLLFILVL